MHEPDGEADCQQYEPGDNDQAHVYFHDRFDAEISEKVLCYTANMRAWPIAVALVATSIGATTVFARRAYS